MTKLTVSVTNHWDDSRQCYYWVWVVRQQRRNGRILASDTAYSWQGAFVACMGAVKRLGGDPATLKGMAA